MENENLAKDSIIYLDNFPQASFSLGSAEKEGDARSVTLHSMPGTRINNGTPD